MRKFASGVMGIDPVSSTGWRRVFRSWWACRTMNILSVYPSTGSGRTERGM